jgi:hypothetical protein
VLTEPSKDAMRPGPSREVANALNQGKGDADVHRTLLTALVLASAAGAAALPAAAQAPMQPGERRQLGDMIGGRTVRDVMISQGGGGITVIYDMAPGQPQSQRVLRLENVNGMLEVIYDQAAPTMDTATGGTPRLVQRGGGMYSVEYDQAPPRR